MVGPSNSLYSLLRSPNSLLRRVGNLGCAEAETETGARFSVSDPEPVAPEMGEIPAEFPETGILWPTVSQKDSLHYQP